MRFLLFKSFENQSFLECQSVSDYMKIYFVIALKFTNTFYDTIMVMVNFRHMSNHNLAWCSCREFVKKKSL